MNKLVVSCLLSCLTAAAQAQYLDALNWRREFPIFDFEERNQVYFMASAPVSPLSPPVFRGQYVRKFPKANLYLGISTGLRYGSSDSLPWYNQHRDFTGFTSNISIELSYSWNRKNFGFAVGCSPQLVIGLSFDKRIYILPKSVALHLRYKKILFESNYAYSPFHYATHLLARPLWNMHFIFNHCLKFKSRTIEVYLASPIFPKTVSRYITIGLSQNINQFFVGGELASNYAIINKTHNNPFRDAPKFNLNDLSLSLFSVYEPFENISFKIGFHLNAMFDYEDLYRIEPRSSMIYSDFGFCYNF